MPSFWYKLQQVSNVLRIKGIFKSLEMNCLLIVRLFALGDEWGSWPARLFLHSLQKWTRKTRAMIKTNEWSFYSGSYFIAFTIAWLTWMKLYTLKTESCGVWPADGVYCRSVFTLICSTMLLQGFCFLYIYIYAPGLRAVISFGMLLCMLWPLQVLHMFMRSCVSEQKHIIHATKHWSHYLSCMCVCLCVCEKEEDPIWHTVSL